LLFYAYYIGELLFGTALEEVLFPTPELAVPPYPYGMKVLLLF
jgi:hypothetical protein